MYPERHVCDLAFLRCLLQGEVEFRGHLEISDQYELLISTMGGKKPNLESEDFLSIPGTRNGPTVLITTLQALFKYFHSILFS